TRAKAYVPYLAGDLDGAGQLLGEALAQARRAGQERLVIELRATLLPLRLYLATPLAGLREEAAGLAADARSAGRRSAEASAQVTLGDVAWLEDDLDAADRHFAEGNRLSKEIGYTRKRLWSLLGRVQVAIARGEPATARRLANEAIELTTQPDGTADVEAELHLAEACLAGADPEGAAAALARAWAVLQEVDVFSRARLQRAQARLAASAGDPAAAAGVLERALAGPESNRPPRQARAHRRHRQGRAHPGPPAGPARGGWEMTRRRSQAEEAALLRVLGQSPIFRHGRPEALNALATQAVPFDYPVGSFLMRQGEPADHVLVLTAGEVAIVSPVRGG